MTLLDMVKRRFARPPEPVRAAVEATPDSDERVLAWGSLVRDEGWLVATTRGLRVVNAAGGEAAALLPWHEVGHARWAATADGGGSFTITPLTEVEPGVQARLAPRRHALSEPGELPQEVRRRVDRTVVSQPALPAARTGAGSCSWRADCPVRRPRSGPSSSTTTSTAPTRWRATRPRGELAAASPPSSPTETAGQRGGVAAHLRLDRGQHVVGARLRHAGDALQARVVLRLGPRPADLLVALASRPGRRARSRRRSRRGRTASPRGDLLVGLDGLAGERYP